MDTQVWPLFLGVPRPLARVTPSQLLLAILAQAHCFGPNIFSVAFCGVSGAELQTGQPVMWEAVHFPGPLSDPDDQEGWT